MLLVLAAGAPAYAVSEVHISNEFSETYNSISGPGSSQSSLTKGWRFLDVLGVNGTGDLGKGWIYLYNFGLKATDDPHNDLKKASITNLNVRFSNRTHTVNFGDTFESFSQYTLNSALKGASYRYAAEGAVLSEVTLLSGFAYPRWDNAFSLGQGRVHIADRLVWGARTKVDPAAGVSVGFNAVGARDVGGIGPADVSYDNAGTYAVDLDYKPLPGLTVRGEAAYGHARELAAGGTGSLKHHGNAFRLEAVGDQDPSRVTLEYERVSSDVLTLTGSATADREKAKGRWRYKASKTVTTNLALLWFHDNLDGAKTGGTTYYYKPEAGVTFKNVLGRKYALVDLSYKLDYAEQRNATVRADSFVNVNYRDRFWLIDADSNFGYTAYHTLGTSGTRRNEFTGNTTVGSRHTLDWVTLSPSLYFGFWRSNDELAASDDEIVEYSGGMNVDFPAANVTSNFRGGQNRLLKTTGDNSAKIFASAAAYWRPKQLQSFSQTMLYARYALNDFAFKASANRDYRENSLTLGLNFMF